MKLFKLASLSLAMMISNCLLAEGGSTSPSNETSAPQATAKPSNAPTDAKIEAKQESTGASSANYTCSMASAKRTVRVAYEKEGSKVPCKVNYVRDASSNEEKVLYNASTEEGFCEKKAGEFVEKLKSSGWTCTNP